ncbi:MAG: tetratricopeptide repeat protein [Candidatus Glassbacteria bacterium]|nr:tetratricopeptide repeat protein [Candidatus Glassbacteria bacterium]
MYRGIIKKYIPAALVAAAMALIPPPAANAAVPPQQEYWQLLVSRYQASSENYAEPLLEEFVVFRALYPRTVHGDSLAWMSGTLYEHRKNKPLALASYLKLLYVYPQSPLIRQAQERLDPLASSRRRGITALFADDKLEVLQDYVLRILERGVETEGGERGYFDFLLLLADASVKDLASYLVDQGRHYLYRAGYSWRADRVCVIIGDMQQLQKKWRSALLAYRSAAIVDPFGEAVGLALLRAGEVYLGPLKNYEMARTTLGEVVERYPAAMDAARASLLLAEVDLAEKSYEQAIVQLEDTAVRFPYPEIRIEAWEKAAWVYLKHLEDPQKAAAFYERIVQEHPEQTRSAEALIHLGKLHEERTGDMARAVQAYRKLAELFPENPLAPRYLYRAGELAEDKLKDSELAAEIYSQAAAGYPESDEGKKARKKLN